MFLIATIGETESGDSFSGSREIRDSLSRLDGERRERHDGGPSFAVRRLSNRRASAHEEGTMRTPAGALLFAALCAAAFPTARCILEDYVPSGTHLSLGVGDDEMTVTWRTSAPRVRSWSTDHTTPTPARTPRRTSPSPRRASRASSRTGQGPDPPRDARGDPDRPRARRQVQLSRGRPRQGRVEPGVLVHRQANPATDRRRPAPQDPRRLRHRPRGVRRAALLRAFRGARSEDARRPRPRFSHPLRRLRLRPARRRRRRRRRLHGGHPTHRRVSPVHDQRGEPRVGV